VNAYRRRNVKLALIFRGGAVLRSIIIWLTT